MESCTKLQTFDYFEGSEVSYALSFLAVGVWTVGKMVIHISTFLPFPLSSQESRVVSIHPIMNFLQYDSVGNVIITQLCSVYFSTHFFLTYPPFYSSIIVELCCLCCIMMFRRVNKQPGIQKF